MSLTRYDISDNQLAYIAGFIDGEGCILTYGNRLRVQASNTVKAPLELIQSVFGGSIRECKRPGKWRTLYIWTVHASTAVEVLRYLLPYLIVKKAQAILAIKFRTETGEANKAGLASELKILKHM